MNARDHTTWTAFCDHPIFTQRDQHPTEWSSDPSMYDGTMPEEFLPEWYVHCDPKLPTAVQAIADRDFANLKLACELLEAAFGRSQHELFILDDFTVFVRLTCSAISLELFGHDYGDGDEIMTVDVQEPLDHQFLIDTMDDLIPQLRSVLSSRRSTNDI